MAPKRRSYGTIHTQIKTLYEVNIQKEDDEGQKRWWIWKWKNKKKLEWLCSWGLKNAKKQGKMLVFIMHFNSNYCSLKTFGREKKKIQIWNFGN